MLTLSKETRLPPDRIMEHAREFFEGNLGLESENATDCCIEFVSNLGFIEIRINDNGDKREVVAHTREYEFQVRDFIRKLK